MPKRRTKPVRALRRRWTASDLKRLRTMHGRGTPGQSIAKALGRSVSAIYQKITTEGLSRRRRKTRVTRRARR